MGSTQPGSVHGSRAHRDREFSTAASRTAAASVTGGSETLSRDTWLWKRGSLPPTPCPFARPAPLWRVGMGRGELGRTPHLGVHTWA